MCVSPKNFLFRLEKIDLRISDTFDFVINENIFQGEKMINDLKIIILLYAARVAQLVEHGTYVKNMNSEFNFQ